MVRSDLTARFALFLLLMLMLGVVPVLGASAVVGAVAGSTNATVGGQALVANTTLFSGDSLPVSDGTAVVAMGMGSRMVFGRDTVASFERGPDEVTVLLGRGSVSIYHPKEGVGLRVKVGEISVSAGKEYKTLGEVAMVNGIIVVTAKEGSLRVEGTGRALEVKEGKTVTIAQNAGRAPSGQVGAAGGAAHVGSSLTLPITTLAAAGTGAVFTVTSLSKMNSANDTLNKTGTDAGTAILDAAAAQAAAAGLAAATAAACQAVSPSDPACTPH